MRPMIFEVSVQLVIDQRQDPLAGGGRNLGFCFVAQVHGSAMTADRIDREAISLGILGFIFGAPERQF